MIQHQGLISYYRVPGSTILNYADLFTDVDRLHMILLSNHFHLQDISIPKLRVGIESTVPTILGNARGAKMWSTKPIPRDHWTKEKLSKAHVFD